MADEVVIDTLRIEVTGDTGKATEGIDKLITTLEKIKSAANGGNKGLSSISATIEKINNAVSGIDTKTNKKLKNLADGIKGLSDVGKIKFGHTAEGIMALGYAIDSLKDVDFSKLAEMSSGVQTLSSVGNFNVIQVTGGSPTVDPTVAQSLEETIEAVSQTEKRTRDELARTTSHFSKFGAEIRKAIKDPQKAIKEFQNSATKALLKVQSAASKLSKAVKLYFSAMALPFRPLTKRLSEFGSRLSNLFTMIKKRTMYRAINAALSAITKGLKEGTDNAYQYSKAINGPFASSMDRISTTLLYFRNSIGAAVMPLVNMLAPAIDLIVDKAVELINTFNQLFARLSGASTWTKAIRYPKEYAEAAEDAKKANEDLKKTILGFDQLNVLNDNSSKDSSKSKSGDDYSKMFEEVAFANAIKNPFADFFKPFKDAWANEGQNTINAIKTAFEQVKGALAAVGESFRTVWLNGTGQQSVETILRIVQNIVGAAGNLAESFKNAWKENEVGTGIVQGIWDIFNSILGTIERITGATKVWAEQLNLSPLLEAVKRAVEAVKPIIDKIGDAISWVWENIVLPIVEWGLEKLLPSGLNLVSAALELLGTVIEKIKPGLEWFWDNILKPLGEWTGEKIINALNTVTGLLEKLNDLISGETTFKEFIDSLSLGETFALALGTAIGVLVAGLAAYTAIMAVVNGVTAIFAALTSPVTLIILGVVAAIAAVVAIIVVCVKHWDEIKEAAIKAWNKIKETWDKVASWFNEHIITPVKNFFTKLWEGISNAASTAWEAIKKFFAPAVEWFSKLFGSIGKTIKDVFHNIGVIARGCWDLIKLGVTTAWNAIKTVLAPVAEWFRTKIIQPLTNFFRTLWDGFKQKASQAWDGVKQVFSKVGSFFSDTFSKAWAGVVKVFSVGGEIFVKIKDGVLSGFKWVVNKLIDGINSVVAIPFKGINGVLGWLKNISIAGLTPFSGITEINIPQIPHLAQGGMVNAGTMFIAGEAGAEVVAQMGSRTGVMNTDEMQESVERGILNATGSIANAVAAAIIRANQNGGAPTVEVTVTADSETLYKTVRKGEKYYNNRYHVVVGV